MRTLLAYSGGLDTSYLVATLSAAGHEVTACTVDCGGFSPTERDDLRERALALGAREHVWIDARHRLFHQVIRWLLAGNVRRGNSYPLCVGAERGIQAAELARLAISGSFEHLAHGCTSAGNDQVRFEAALAILAPALSVLAPLRDEPAERSEQLAWLVEQGLPAPVSGSVYSVNAGLWGLTLGGGELLDSVAPLPSDAWRWTKDGGGSRVLRVTFEEGIPRSLDGEPFEPVELIERLNREAGALGVGRGYHLGDTVLGIKGRIAFEAPAAEVLLRAHAELEKLVLTEDQRFWKDHLGEVYGRYLHQGRLFDPVMRDFEALFSCAQSRVTGEVTLELRAGRAEVVGVVSPHSLMTASEARYGERPASDADPAGPRGLARIIAEPARLYARAAGGTANEAVTSESAVSQAEGMG